MTGARGWKVASVVCRIAAVGCLMAAFTTLRRAPGVADAETEPVVLSITGSLMGAPLAYRWSAALVAENAPVRIDYTQKSSQGGRQVIIEGLDPIAMSPIWFNPEDEESIAALKAGGEKPNFVEVPVSASALLFAELTPKSMLAEVGKKGPPFSVIDVPPPPAGYTSEQFFRFYLERVTLSDTDYAALHSYKVYKPVYDDNNPDAEPPPPAPDEVIPADFASVELGARVGPTAMGYMLERGVQAYAPKAWANYIRRNPRPEGPSEQLQIPYSFNGTEASRFASNTYEPMMTESIRFAANKSRPCCLFGGLTPAVFEKFKYDAVRVAYRPEKTATLSNADIELTVPKDVRDRWELVKLSMDGVSPTEANVLKAVATTDGLSDRAAQAPATNGGYPYSYIQKIIVRTDKLKIGDANATADLIRWIATKGQAFTADSLDYPLPAYHVKRALLAANSVVRAVCPQERVLVLGTNPVGGATVNAETCGPKIVAPTTAPTTTATTAEPATSTTSTLPPSTTTTFASTTSRLQSTSTTATTALLRSSVAAGATTTTVARPAAALTTTVEPVAVATTAATTVSQPSVRRRASVTPVGRPARQRSPALQSLLGAVAFTIGSQFASRRGEA